MRIEGYPFIIRFKTILFILFFLLYFFSIEGYPFIIRFKTGALLRLPLLFESIEGYPFIIRFKTACNMRSVVYHLYVLKVIHL